MAKKDQRRHDNTRGIPPTVQSKSKKSRKRGTVKFFIKDKGFGFINPDGQELDVFVHCKEILHDGCNTLIEGQKVEFELRQSKL